MAVIRINKKAYETKYGKTSYNGDNYSFYDSPTCGFISNKSTGDIISVSKNPITSINNIISSQDDIKIIDMLYSDVKSDLPIQEANSISMDINKKIDECNKKLLKIKIMDRVAIIFTILILFISVVVAYLVVH